MERLFVYGTLGNPAVQQRVMGREITGTPDTLDGWFKAQITLGDGTFPIIIPNAGTSVDGLVLELSDEELLRTDIYETSAYRRRRVALRSGVEAWVYTE